MARMSGLSVIFSMLFLVFFILAAGCSESDQNPRMLSSTVDYNLKIYASDTITNVTFFIPLPVKNGMPMVGALVLDQDLFRQENVSVEIVRSPPGMNLTNEYPLQNNTAWFLKITARQIIPEAMSQAVYKINTENTTSVTTPLLFSNTLSPFGNESVFLPKMQFSPSTPVMNISRSPYWIEYTPSQDPQTLPVFAEYSASPLTNVRISAYIHGSNFWLQGYDSWIGNSYWDIFDWHHTGAFGGWQTATGEFESAEGIYPNLTNPEWQMVLNRTSPGAS